MALLMSPLEPFIVLFAAHLIGDFVLQTEQMALKKAHVLGWLMLHAAELGAITWLLCWSVTAWPVVLAVFISHVLFDWVKPRLPGSQLLWYIVDQAGHILVIWVGCVMWMVPHMDFMRIYDFVPYRVLVIFAAFLLVGRPITIGLGLFLRPWHQEILQSKDVDPEHTPITGLTRAGAWIGNLERFLVLACVLGGQPMLVGFLLVAKAVMRFGETSHLDERKRGDYAIIGTLGSFLLALLVGLLAQAAIQAGPR